MSLPGEDQVGLITYMRTDSVTLSEVALTEIRQLISERYGPENVPQEVRRFKAKAKNAQEAHEAVRPTSVVRTPDELKTVLDEERKSLKTFSFSLRKKVFKDFLKKESKLI